MNDGEDYIIEVLRIVEKNIFPNLNNNQKEKFSHILERLKTSNLFRGEIALLQKVENFQKPAMAMEWILLRESQVKIKNYSAIFQKDVKLLEDEFKNSFNNIISEEKEKTLIDLIDKNLLVGFQRFTEIINSLPKKSPNERRAVIVLLMMVAKSSVEMAKSKKNLILENLFKSIISFVEFVESKGEIESSKVADLLANIGEKLINGLHSSASGVEILNEVNGMLMHPKKVLG